MYFRPAVTQENTLSDGRGKETQRPEPQGIGARKGRSTEGKSIKGVDLGEEILNNQKGFKNMKGRMIMNPC